MLDDRKTWIKRGITKHLGKEEYYRELSHEEADNIMKETEIKFKNIIWESEKYQKEKNST